MKRKAFVLLSGGLDSTTCLYIAAHQFWGTPPNAQTGKTLDYYLQYGGDVDWVEAVSIDYGQRHLKETEYARRTCDRLGIAHTVLPVGPLLSGQGVMLTDPSAEVPDISYAEIKGVSPTYVPFRNGLMLSAIAAHAQKYVNAQIEASSKDGKDEWDHLNAAGLRLNKEEATQAAKDLCGIYAGMHAEDAQNHAYPDCTPEFLGAMANAIYVGTYSTVRLHSPLQWMMKHQIVEWGTKLGVPYEDTWSCYKGDTLHCGVCPTCRSRKDAFKAAGVPDPTQYAA
jgi:7-cyano-7-deazaguanine synthase